MKPSCLCPRFVRRITLDPSNDKQVSYTDKLLTITRIEYLYTFKKCKQF